MAGIRHLVHLIPTDSDVSDSLDVVSYSTVNPPAAADASPKMTSRIKRLSGPMKAGVGEAKASLEKLFDTAAAGMNPFRVLYNLEVLSSRIMAPTPQGGHNIYDNANDR